MLHAVCIHKFAISTGLKHVWTLVGVHVVFALWWRNHPPRKKVKSKVENPTVILLYLTTCRVFHYYYCYYYNYSPAGCTSHSIVMPFVTQRQLGDVQWWANHKSNHKYKSQIICKNDLNQNLKSKIKSQIIKSNPNHFWSKSNQITNQFYWNVKFLKMFSLHNNYRISQKSQPFCICQ